MKSTLLDCIKKIKKNEPTVLRWLENIQKGELPDFNLGSNGILRFRNRIVAPRDEELKKKIIEETHRSRYTVHPDSGKMYQDLKGLY